MRTLTPITAQNEPTGTGDGMKTVFNLLYQGVQIFDPQDLNVWSVYRNDWQGNQRLYALPRTNLVKQSQNLSASPWVATATVSSSSSTYAGTIPYYQIANTSTTVNNGISIAFGQSFVAGQNVVLTVALRAYAATVATIGISGTADLWGSPSNAVCNVLSGPGTIKQVPSSGSLFTISGLSTTQDTLVQVTRTYGGNESDGGVYIYPGDYAAIAGSTWVAPHYIATNAQFGTGNGSSTSFQLSVGGIPVYNNIVVSSIYRNDWQGNQLLYSTARTNQVPNGTMAGATAGVIGSGGALPTGLVLEVNDGLTTTIVGSGTEANGRPYLELSITGTATSTQYTLRTSTLPTALAGQTLTASASYKVTGGTLPAANPIISNVEASGSFPATNSSIAPVSGSYASGRATRTVTSSSTGMQERFIIPTTMGQSVNLTIRLSAWQFETGPTATSFIPTTTAAVTVTDYTVGSTGLVTMGQTPVSGAVLTWSGSGDSYTSILAGRVQCEYGTAGTSYIATAGSAVTTTDYTVSPYGSITLSVPPRAGASLTWSGTAEIFLLDSVKTLLAQYANSPTLDQWIDFFNQWIDPAVDIDNFFNFCWNVLTAQGFGLDNWGTIVGVNRQITLSAIPDYLGFKEALPGSEPWNQAPWFGGPTTSQVYDLSDDSFRTLILTKALANISNFTAPSINHLLQFLFAGRGSCYVLELSPMQIEYVFNFPLQTWEAAVLLQPALMPRPAGVGVTITVTV